MRRPSKLPAPCADATFTLADAQIEGVTRGRLRSSDIEPLGRMIFSTAESLELPEYGRALSTVTPEAWISHQSAAVLHKLWLPRHMTEFPGMHLSKPRSLPEVRRRGVISHNVHVLPHEIQELEGVRISTPARTWLDLARYLSLRDLVAMGDQLVRWPRSALEIQQTPFSTPSALAEMLKSHSNMQGIRMARLALEQVRIGSDSPPETFLRLALVDAGLAEPELQVSLDPEIEGSPQSDLGYRRWKIAIQYDGGHHLTPQQQSSDNRRDENSWLRVGLTFVSTEKT